MSERRLKTRFEVEATRHEKIIVASKAHKAETAAEEKPKKPKETPIEFLASLAGVCLFIITFVVQAFAIPSSSMENTLLVGDHVFVSRVGFAPKSSWLGPLVPYQDIRRGEIVAFVSPPTPGLYIVKTVIAVPGDRSARAWCIATGKDSKSEWYGEVLCEGLRGGAYSRPPHRQRRIRTMLQVAMFLGEQAWG